MVEAACTGPGLHEAGAQLTANRGGGAVLRRYTGRGKPGYPSVTLPPSTVVPCLYNCSYSGGGDYGRTSDWCSV
eukprot:5193966-Pleurochrysis_carterae.AAC.1